MRRRASGQLEAEVLQRLWQFDQPVTGAELRSDFDERERPAATTLLTILTRLQDKGLVVRSAAERGGARFAAVRVDADEAAAAMTRSLEHASDRTSALVRFAGQLNQDDLVALRRLVQGQD